MVRKIKLITCLFIFFAVTAGISATDLTPEQEASAQRLFGEVLSPYCPGRLLNDCPSGAASELKEKIRVKLKNGEGEDAVLEYLYDQFGEGALRSVPKAEGFGLVGWVVPGVFVLMGLLVLVRWLKASSAEMAAPHHPKLDIDPELARRIEKDLES